MTNAECEIVANAGVQLREIAERLTVPHGIKLSLMDQFSLVRRMDASALAISEVYGKLSDLPLENEGEKTVTEDHDLTIEVLDAVDARWPQSLVLDRGEMERLLSLVYLDGRKAGLEAARAVYAAL